MPFARNSELPASVRNVLPAEAQTVFRRVVNSQLDRGLSESRAFASAWAALRNQGWRKGSDGKWHKVEKFEHTFEIVAKNEELRVVYGWASVIEENGEAIVDHQDDVIYEDDLEKVAHDFLLVSRDGTEMHEEKATRCVASLVFTKQVQKILGIDLRKVGWFVGFKVDRDETWLKVQSGELSMFSIGGSALRVPEAA